jgi:hypothetical protein
MASGAQSCQYGTTLSGRKLETYTDWTSGPLLLDVIFTISPGKETNTLLDGALTRVSGHYAKDSNDERRTARARAPGEAKARTAGKPHVPQTYGARGLVHCQSNAAGASTNEPSTQYVRGLHIFDPAYHLKTHWGQREHMIRNALDRGGFCIFQTSKPRASFAYRPEGDAEEGDGSGIAILPKRRRSDSSSPEGKENKQAKAGTQDHPATTPSPAPLTSTRAVADAHEDAAGQLSWLS